MRKLPDTTRLLGERYKVAALTLRSRVIENWDQRVKKVDRSENLRSVYSRTLEDAREISIERTAAVIFFKNSISSEWKELRRAYPKVVREKIRGEIIDTTGIDPHALYLQSQKRVMNILASTRIRTLTEFRAIQEFIDELDSEDKELTHKCQRMLDEFELRLMSQSARPPRA